CWRAQGADYCLPLEQRLERTVGSILLEVAQDSNSDGVAEVTPRGSPTCTADETDDDADGVVAWIGCGELLLLGDFARD
ncbi:unnamed protein product, partial [Symbiodinium microadriaticum]